MQRLPASAFLLCLSACSSLSPQVAGSAVDYSQIMESFTNQVLIVNVLRARDQSSLNFGDLPIIRGSIAAQADLSAIAVLQGIEGTTARSTLTPGLQFSNSPTEVPTVHSFQVLSLLSRLVSSAKLSSDIPVTRSFAVQS